MDLNGTGSILSSIQPVHVALGIFAALMIGALLSLRDMGTERRSRMLGKLLGKVVMFLGSLAVGAYLLTSTFGGSLPIGDIQSVIQQVQGLPAGTPSVPATGGYKVDFTMFDEINRKLFDSGGFSPTR
jgi:hypothetical protein